MMEMCNMKLDKKEMESKAETMVVDSSAPEGGPQYPWGLTVRLEKESLDKLGIDLADYSLGDIINLTAKCCVKELRQSEGEGDQSKTVELQITDMGIEKEDDQDQGPDEGDENSMGWDEEDAKVDEKLRKRGY